MKLPANVVFYKWEVSGDFNEGFHLRSNKLNNKLVWYAHTRCKVFDKVLSTEHKNFESSLLGLLFKPKIRIFLPFSLF